MVHECLQVGLSACSVHQQVHVVRHEAVRNKCKPVALPASPKMQHTSLCNIRYLERAMLVSRAGCEEIPLISDVRRVAQPAGTVRDHTRCRASSDPDCRTKVLRHMSEAGLKSCAQARLFDDRQKLCSACSAVSALIVFDLFR